MKIELRYDEGITILALDGRLTIGDGDVALRDAVDELLAEGTTRVVLNLEKVRAMDSSGLGELLRLRSRAQSIGADIRLAAAGSVMEILEMTRLIGVFEIYDDDLSAIASFR